MDHEHPWIGLATVTLGSCLTIVWWGNNSAVHRYVLYWWQSLKAVEKTLGLQDDGCAFVSNHPGSGKPLHYSDLMQIIPGLFMAGWMVLAEYGIRLLRGATMGGTAELATILAGVAGLWAIAMAWFTYTMMTRNDNKRLFDSLKSLVSGVRSELDWIRPWASADGDGYSKTTRPEDCPPDWRNPWIRLHTRFAYFALCVLSWRFDPFCAPKLLNC